MSTRDEHQPHYEPGCMACDVLKGLTPTPGGVIHEDDFWMLDHSTSPVLLPGFLISKPKRHVEHIGDLTAEELESLARILGIAYRAMSRALEAEKVYTCSFGEGVKHVHLYLVPRTKDMPPDGFEVIRAMFDDGRWLASDDDGMQAAKAVRESIRTELSERSHDSAD